MIIQSSFKKILIPGLAGLLLTLGIGWLVMQARQRTFRSQSEALLADIKSLDPGRSSWSDAQRIMTRWGRWGGWVGNCDSEDCYYSIDIYHLPLVYPSFVHEEGPHLGARILEQAGLRSAAVTARFRVEHGVVTSKEFGLAVALPVSQWITPGGHFWQKDEDGSSYWPSLSVAFREGAEPESIPDQTAEHPNRGFIQRRITLLAGFTPNESPEEQAALTDFHFDCITRWHPCSNRGELLPRAEEEFEAERHR